MNATIVSNPTGVSANGTTRIRNSLLTKNGVALSSATAAMLTSTFDDLFGNQTDYAGLTAGSGDISAAVTFSDFAAHDLTLGTAQPSTDRGDPTDPVGAEPVPNGGRINLGAFGGTAEAETSAPSDNVIGDPSGHGPAPQVTPPGQQTTPESPKDDSGCAVAGGGPSRSGLAWVLLALLASRRRRQT